MPQHRGRPLENAAYRTVYDPKIRVLIVASRLRESPNPDTYIVVYELVRWRVGCVLRIAS
jgi:hypothetical protein